MLPAIVTPISVSNPSVSPEKPGTPPNSDTSAPDRFHNHPNHSQAVHKRGIHLGDSPDRTASLDRTSKPSAEHGSPVTVTDDAPSDRPSQRHMREDSILNTAPGMHSRDRSMQRKLPPTMLDMYLPKTTSISYRAAESSRSRSPLTSIPTRPQSMIQMRVSDPNYSQSSLKSRGIGIEVSGGILELSDFESNACKARLNHMVKYNSDCVEYEVRVAEIVNKIAKRPANIAPDMELLQNALDLLNEFYRFAGPLESLLTQLQGYVKRCVFSQRRCASRCCTDPNAPYFEHVRHMENERDYVREEYQEIERKSKKKNEHIAQLQEEIAELKGNCEFKEQEIRLQRKIFDKEQEKDVNRTMTLYADVEAAESECEGYRLRVVELIDIITRMSRKVKDLEIKRALNGEKRDEIKVDFSEDWQRLGELQTKILDHVPKSVLKEAQTELNQKKEALSILKSKYFVLHTAHKKLKATNSEYADKINELEDKIKTMGESMTPRPDLKPLMGILGEFGENISTFDVIASLVKTISSLKSTPKDHGEKRGHEIENEDTNGEERTNDTDMIDGGRDSSMSKQTDISESHGNRQAGVTASCSRKYHANLGISDRIPIFLRNSFTSARCEYRHITKSVLDTIIKEIFTKRLEELRSLYGNFRSLNREEKYTAGSKILKNRISFADFIYNFLKMRYNTGATEWARNILSASEMHKSDPICLIFYKTATQSICEDAYFEMQNLIFYLRETLNKAEKAKLKKGDQSTVLTMDDILEGIQETFPSKGDDDIHVVRQLLTNQYKDSRVNCDTLFGDNHGKPSVFVEVLQDQYIVDMEELLLNIEQCLESGASEIGVSPTQATAVIQTIDPEAPLEVVKNSVAVGFQVTTTELETYPIAPVDVYSFMKRLKQIMVRRFTKPERHRR